MRQIAVLPYRTLGLAVDAPIQILLITSRETRRWVIPKGGLMKGLPPHSAAAVEAEEEAGVLGAVCPTPIGSYRYRKRRRSGASVWADVDVRRSSARSAQASFALPPVPPGLSAQS